MIKKWQLILLAVLMITPGCKTTTRFQPKFETATGSTEHLYQNLQIQEPEISVESEQQFDTGPLENFNFDDPGRFQRLSLDECISRALQESQVIRELGGTILRSPELIRSEDDPAITYTDPRVGEEAALAEFDANFSNQFLFQNNDRAFNSSFVGDQGILTQDLATNITNLTKRSATGGLFQLNHQIVYDRNNTPANRFLNDASYDTFLAAEFRQPLLQGAGTTFNRIAGPNNLPGVNTGVLIARANTDISLADFELGIRNLVSDVENAYWDLYFAYRDLEAKIEARNGAFSIWENLKARSGEKGEAEILQAEEQYYLFASRVQDAIHGQLNDGTRTNNGSTGGTFRGNSGVRLAERRLRLLTGLPVNDSSLIIPSDMPVEADVVFDWAQIKTDALQYRTELRRQRWVLKRAQLNHLANKNHLLPRLDLIGRYRVRGFGNDLFGNDGFDPTVPPGIDPQNDSDAFATFLNGDLQEWEVGMDLNIPIGYRRQMAAVRNSELNFMREKKVLLEQEREIIYGLSNAVGEIDRTGSLLDVNTSRLEASKKQYRAIQQDYENDDTTIDLVLESQRRVIDAKLDYFRVQVERMLAIKSVHFEKGTILAYHNVSLTESEWKERDIRQANEREMNKSGIVDYFCPGLKISNPSSTPEIGFATDETILLSEADQKAGEQSAELGRKILNGELKDSDAPQFAKTGKKTEPENLGPEHSILLQFAKQLEQADPERSAVQEALEESPLLKLARLAEEAELANRSQAESSDSSVNQRSKSSPVLPTAGKTAEAAKRSQPSKKQVLAKQVLAKQVSTSKPTLSAKPSLPGKTTAKLIIKNLSKKDEKVQKVAGIEGQGQTQLAGGQQTQNPTPVNKSVNSNSIQWPSKPVSKSTKESDNKPAKSVTNPKVLYQPPSESPAAARLKKQVKSLYNPHLNQAKRSSKKPFSPPKTPPQTSIQPAVDSGMSKTSILPSQSTSSRRK